MYLDQTDLDSKGKAAEFAAGVWLRSCGGFNENAVPPSNRFTHLCPSFQLVERIHCFVGGGVSQVAELQKLVATPIVLPLPARGSRREHLSAVQLPKVMSSLTIIDSGTRSPMKCFLFFFFICCCCCCLYYFTTAIEK